MLVLERLIKEKVVIRLGDTVVTVQLVDIRGGKVRLGFDAPLHVDIDREEIAFAKEQDRERLRQERMEGGR